MVADQPAPKRADRRRAKPKAPETPVVSAVPIAVLPLLPPRRRPPRLPVGLAGLGWRFDTKTIDAAAAVASAEPVIANPECDMQLKRIVEAILFAAERPMTARQIQQVFPELEQPQLSEIQAAIDSIAADYRDRPVGLKQLASGYRFQVREGLAFWVGRLFEERPARYSRALLETLAIIAYRQPVTRGEIEDIRGVAVSTGIMHTLLEREWVRVIGHKEVPGRPALYSTTRQFLDYFNLSSLDQLPTLEELAGLDFNDAQPEKQNSDRTQTQPSENPVGQAHPPAIG